MHSPLSPTTSLLENASINDTSTSSSSSYTNFQRNKIALIGLVLFVNHFSMFVIFPFLPELIAFLAPDKSQGIYAGILASAFNIGAFASGLIWGPLADRWGRRPVLLAGIVGTAISALMFGFSTNYWMAVFARMIWGVLNGNVPVAKAYLSEICDESNQAKGFAIIGFAGSFGRMVGPVIGGVLANPVKKYPNTFIGNVLIFQQFPYLLPMAVGVTICIIVFPIAYFGLEESLQNNERVKSNDNNLKDVFEVLKNSSVFKSICLFGMISFAAYMIEEIFVLWLALSIALGGFGIQSTQIGLLLFACAPVPLVSQILVFPRLVNYIGFKSVFNSSMLIMGITFALIPFSNNLLGLSSVYPAWTYLAVTFTFFLVGRFFGFASVYALINNSCDRHRGSVNGIGQSVASLARIIAPIIGGAMYSFSVSKAENRDSIIDVRLIFFFLAAWCSCTAFLGLSLPDSINRKGSENAKSSAAEQMKDPSISIKESS